MHGNTVMRQCSEPSYSMTTFKCEHAQAIAHRSIKRTKTAKQCLKSKSQVNSIPAFRPYPDAIHAVGQSPCNHPGPLQIAVLHLMTNYNGYLHCIKYFLSANRPVKGRLPCQPDLPFRKPTRQASTDTFAAVATQLGATPT